jgi:hypothetical protein
MKRVRALPDGCSAESTSRSRRAPLALASGRFRVRDLGWQVLDLGGETYVFDGVPVDAGVTPVRSRD